MTAPKSFEWRGYWFDQDQDSGHWLASKDRRYVCDAATVDACKAYIREMAKQRFAEAQAEFDRVMAPEETT